MRPTDCVGRDVRTLDNKIFRTLVAYGEELGVDEGTVMYSWILGFIYDNPQREIFQKDIESEFSIAKSTVTGIVQMMEKRGYISRVSVERDARLKKLQLTEEGRMYHEATVKNLDKLEETLRRNIAPQDLHTFFRVLHKMLDNLSMKK